MASVLKVDEITGVTTAGSIAVTGEGNSTTTNLQQGLAKAWLYGTTTAGTTDSFNVGGGTDHGTGDYSYSFTNAMVNNDYSQSGMASSTDQRRNLTQNGARYAASTIAVELSDAGTNDDTNHCVTIHGELA